MSARLFQRREAGFTLVEVTLALGLFAFLVVALLGLLGGGLQTAREIQSDHRVKIIAENVWARYLVDPAFPGFGARNEIELFCDENGQLCEGEAAPFRLHLRRTKHPHWDGGHLEAARAEIRNGRGVVLTAFPLVRATEKPVR